MRKLLYLIFCAFAVTCVKAQALENETIPAEQVSEPNGILTLNDALALALMHNPRLAAYSWEIRAAGARAMQEGLKPNPELEIEVEEAGGTGDRSGFDGAQTTIQLSQQIERSGKASKRKNLARFETELASWDYRSKKLDILADATKAFIDVLAAQENVKLSRDLLHLAESQAFAVTQRVQAGKDAPLESNKAQILLSQISIMHRQAALQLENARRQLSLLWASDTPVFAKAEGGLEDIPNIPSYEEFAQKLSLNPDVARWSDEIARSRARESLEKANAKQDWTVSAGMQRFNEDHDNAVVFGLSIPLPINNRNQGNIAAARYNTRKVKQEQKAALSETNAVLSQAYSELSSSYTQAKEIKESILENSRSAFEMAQVSYQNGKSDYLHVLDAQRTFIDVQSEYISALANCHKSRADVQRLTGTIEKEEFINGETSYEK